MVTESPPLSVLEEDERRTRGRLQIYRAKFYAKDQPRIMTSLNHLHRLERNWQLAAERLAAARKATGRPS